jgi:hypothetical protein
LKKHFFYNFALCSTSKTIENKGKGIKKPHISDGLSSVAPQGGLFSNQFWDELRVYATLNYLIIQVVHNRGVVLILIVLAIL